MRVERQGGRETRERKLIFLCFVFSFPFLHIEEVKEEYQPGPPVTDFQSLMEINPLPSVESCSSCSGHNSEEWTVLGEAGLGSD